MRRDRKRKMSFENNRIKELGKSAFRYELPLDRIVTTTSNGKAKHQIRAIARQGQRGSYP